MKRCYNCGTAWETEKHRPGFKECCEKCSAYLRCCKNCRFHDPRRNNNCSIPAADWVGSAENANLCDDFEFAMDGGKRPGKEGQQQARDSFQSLFGEDADEAGAKPPADFNKLFGG